jgi:hypothetical protein
MANPAAQVTLEELRMRRDSPSTKRWQWLRFTCNVRSEGRGLRDPARGVGRLARPSSALVTAASPTTSASTSAGRSTTPRHAARLGVRRAPLIADVVTLAPPVDEDEIVARC